MTNEPVDTASKERRRQAYHTILQLCQDAPQLKSLASYVTVLLQLQPCSSQQPSLHTKDSSSNKSTKYERWRHVAKITNNKPYAK